MRAREADRLTTELHLPVISSNTFPPESPPAQYQSPTVACPCSLTTPPVDQDLLLPPYLPVIQLSQALTPASIPWGPPAKTVRKASRPENQ